MDDHDLGAELDRLAGLRPSPLRTVPVTGGPAPVAVELAAWATGVAEDLHRRFGDRVELVVGFLAFPSRRRAGYPTLPLRPPQHFPTADPAELEVGLTGPLSVASGKDGWTTLWIENHSHHPVTIVTHGHVTGRVVDHDGEGVGGSPTAEQLRRVDVHLEPHSRHPLDVLVGAASTEPALGYSVPPGAWAVDVLLELGDGRRLRTPALPLTVT